MKLLVRKAALDVYGTDDQDEIIKLIEEEDWNYGTCKTLDGCTVEPDGTCEHGSPSFMLALGVI